MFKESTTLVCGLQPASKWKYHEPIIHDQTCGATYPASACSCGGVRYLLIGGLVSLGQVEALTLV